MPVKNICINFTDVLQVLFVHCLEVLALTSSTVYLLVLVKFVFVLITAQ